MEVKTKIKKHRGLKDFTRLLLAFVGGLVALAVYQQAFLRYTGVLETAFNKTVFLLVWNHLGFTALLAFVLLLVFRFLERGQGGLGFKVCLATFGLVLGVEALLTSYFCHNHSLLFVTDLNAGLSLNVEVLAMLQFVGLVAGIWLLFYLFYKLAARVNQFIAKLYPFTIILLLLVLGTHLTVKKPINQNKTMAFISQAVAHGLYFEAYDGPEYPLKSKLEKDSGFVANFKLEKKPPNFVIIVVDGLSGQLIKDGKYAGFTPFMDSLSQKSLYWHRFLANSTSPIDAVTNIVGSLPQGKNGFTGLAQTADRNTLFGLLKANGYHTGFYFGGNATLQHLGKFLKEERVDVVLDRARFNDDYKLQAVDRAGVSLGYPDGELYKKWASSYFWDGRPKMEVFLNLSTSRPFAVPQEENHLSFVENIVNTKAFSSTEKRFINSNEDVFASMHYADQSLKNLLALYARTKAYQNTVFLITGSGRSYVPPVNALKEHQVPLLVYSPLLKQAQSFDQLASHHDIAPSLMSLLQDNYGFSLPQAPTWMGQGLNVQTKDKAIVLSAANAGVKAIVQEEHFVEGSKLAKITDDLFLAKADKSLEQPLKTAFKQARALNTYVTTANKILPPADVLFQTAKKPFSKAELLWVSSVFSGTNFDDAYTTARDLAHNGNYNKALVLLSFILEEAPGHIDAQVLQGRVYAWKKNYNRSIYILEEAVDLNPFYQDAYAALLDVYFWSGNHARASRLQQKLKENQIEDKLLTEKVARCIAQLDGITQNQTPFATINGFNE